MDANSRGLPADADPRRRAHPQNRPGFMWQWAAIRLFNAVPACPDFSDKTLDCVGHGRDD
jgi:hypothetical protein